MQHDYGNIGFKSAGRRKPTILEFFRGSDIVAWQGRIERQLSEYVDENVDARNYDYADKLRTYLQTWRGHQITGSVNIETVTALETAAAQLAVDQWRYRDYFSNLRDQLRKLKASVEELPMSDVVPPEDRGPSSAPPSSFGAQREAPPGGGAPGATPDVPDAGVDAAAALTGEAPQDTDEEPAE